MNSVWTVQDAKNRFSEVIEHTLHDGPQTITRRGRETTVMVSINTFRVLSGVKGDLVSFFEGSPLSGSDIDLERKSDYGRSIDL
jgi:prevent-host-death family protein